jgi:hypothetical protein
MFSTQTIIVTGVVFWILTCIAVVDVARKDFGGIEKKAAWGFTALVPFVGVIIYFCSATRKAPQKLKSKFSKPPAHPNTP